MRLTCPSLKTTRKREKKGKMKEKEEVRKMKTQDITGPVGLQ